MKKLIHSRSIAVMTVLITAMLFTPLVTSFPTGISGVKDSGCNCHGATTSDSVTPIIVGLPEVYNYSEVYELTVSFTGGPSTPGNINLGGFHLWSSEVGHTDVGNDQTSWTVVWTAPDTDRNVEMILHVNSVNGNAGDGAGSSGDEWNKITKKVNYCTIL